MRGALGALALALALLTLVLAPRTAHADDQREARQLYERGQRLYRSGAYQEAAHHFLRAHEAYPKPAFLFNAAQAHRLGQDCDRSAALYREFLAAQPDHPEAVLIRSHLEDMETCAEHQRAALRHAGLAVTTSEGEEPAERSNAMAWVLTGVGVGLVTASGLFAYDSHRASDEVDRVFENGGTWSPQADAIARRGERSEKLAWLVGGVGVGCLATATYLLVRGDDEEEPGSAPRITAVDRGVVGGWSWRY